MDERLSYQFPTPHPYEPVGFCRGSRETTAGHSICVRCYFCETLGCPQCAPAGVHNNIIVSIDPGVTGTGDTGGMYEVKDSGAREQFASGMVRDTAEGKLDYTLILDGPMFRRWAEHMTKGAVKYSKRNWMKADGTTELGRFKESALRHFIQWFNGETDEDHGAAVFFNINGYEYVKSKIDGGK